MPPKITRLIAGAKVVKKGLNYLNDQQESKLESNSQRTVSASIQINSNSIALSISIEKKTAIDRLLTQAKYRVFAQLRDKIIEDRIHANFYNLFQQEQGVLQFLDDHPVIKRLLINQIKTCIKDFFEELNPNPPVALRQVHTQRIEPARSPVITTTSICLTISVEKQTAIDRLLTQTKYRVFIQLRDHIIEHRINANFYNLFHQEESLIQFLNDHPAMKKMFLKQLNTCMKEFFEELNYKKSIYQAPPPIVDPQLARISVILHSIESAPNDNMGALQARDLDAQTIGHLCLGPYKTTFSARYKAILERLQTPQLLTILKLTNDKNTSIFSLYHSNRFDVCALISKCQDNPKVFCQIIDSFKFDEETIQSLVNVFRLKGKIRTYLLSLPDEPNNWLLLDRCLDQSTSIGNFCAKEANRFFTTGLERETVASIRKKVNARIKPKEPDIREQQQTAALHTEELNEPSFSEHFEPLPYTPGPEIKNAPRDLMLRLENKSENDFWIYTGCAIAILVLLVGAIYKFRNLPEDNISQFKPSM